MSTINSLLYLEESNKKKYPESFTAEAVDLIEKLLQEDPAQRLGSETLGGFDALKKVTCLVKRDLILQHEFFAGIDFNTIHLSPNLALEGGSATPVAHNQAWGRRKCSTSLEFLIPVLTSKALCGHLLWRRFLFKKNPNWKL